MRAITRTVRADVADVWRWLTVPELMDRWIHSIQNLQTVDGAPIGEGSVLRFLARGRAHSTKVVEFEPKRALALQSTQGPVTATYRYTIDERPVGCELTLSIDCHTSGWAALLGPAIGLLAWYTDKGQVDRLKACAEISTEECRA